MFRKTKIISLILVFFISTSGLPAFYNYCNMLSKKSLSECEMCSSAVDKVVTSYCAEETSDYSVSISSDIPLCCQSEFVYNKVNDEFVNNKSEEDYISSSEILFQLFGLIHNSIDFSSEESFYGDSSPPFLIDSEIHITNSSLLI